MSSEEQPGVRTFVRKKEVQFHHCDPAGIVFYPNYLTMMNEVMQDWFNSELGVDYSALFLARRIGVPAVHLECKFLAPSRFGETIRFELRLEEVKRSSLRLRYTVTGPDPQSERLHIEVVLVCIDLDNTGAIPIPDDIRAALRRFQNKGTAMTDFPTSDGVGAGNLLALAAADPDIAGTCVVELDHTYRAPDGRSYDRLTLPELDALAGGIAAGFRRDGIRSKDPVAVFVTESVRYLVLYAALTKLGAIPVFINSDLDPAIAAKILAKVDVSAVVTEPDRTLDGLEGVRRYHTEPFGDPADLPRHEHADDDPVLIAHTSGTTGIPKAVQFNHRGFYLGVLRQRGADLGSRILSALPQSHGSAISVVMSAVVRGAVIRLVTDRKPEDLATDIAAFRPHLVAAFPRAFVNLCRLPLDDYDMSSVARWMSTGDANHETHIRELIRHGNHVGRDGEIVAGSLFIDNFGSSEFGFAMFRNVHGPGTDRYGRCIGKPFDWVRVRILDDNDMPVGPFTVGRLALKSPTMTAGYWNDTSRSEKNRVGGYWLTGDLAFQDDNGLCFHLDRTTDSIVHPDGGTYYSALAEELVMARIPEIFDCSLVSTYRRNADGGFAEGGEIVLTVEIPGSDADPDRVRSRVDEVLAEAGIPAIGTLVVQQGDSHLGVTGKALKREMRESLGTAEVVR